VFRREYPPAFERLWHEYPHRGVPKKKHLALDAWKKLCESDRELLVTAVRNLSLSKEAIDGFAPDMVRFIQRREWCDFVELSESQILDMSRAQSGEERAKAIDREMRKREKDELLVQASDSPDARQLRRERGLPEALADFRPKFKRV